MSEVDKSVSWADVVNASARADARVNRDSQAARPAAAQAPTEEARRVRVVSSQPDIASPSDTFGKQGSSSSSKAVDGQKDASISALPSPGDLLDHPKFGHCTVLRISDGKVFASRGFGRELAISMSHVDFRLAGRAGGRPLFRFIPKQAPR